MLPNSPAGRVSQLLKSCPIHKSHQQRVERIAVIAAHDWQYWLIGAVRIFLHPEVRAYDKSDENEALQWIVGSASGR